MPPIDEGLCTICGVAFKGKIGLGVHTRAKHANAFHLANQVAVRVKPRWGPEDSERLASQEARLRADGVPDREINRNLSMAFSELDYERMKGQRKRQDYKYRVQRILQGIKPSHLRPRRSPPYVRSPLSG